MGCYTLPILRCCPATDQRGDFWLLPFGPGPNRLSLLNLDVTASAMKTILTPSLARTPDRHSTAGNRAPTLIPSTISSSLAARLQSPAKAPSCMTAKNLLYKLTMFCCAWSGRNICSEQRRLYYLQQVLSYGEM